MSMPTEMQCVARQLRKQADELVGSASALPITIAALTNWEMGHRGAAVANVDADEMLFVARTMQFDAVRLGELAEIQADELRSLYIGSMALVDMIRRARGQLLPNEFDRQKVATPDELKHMLDSFEEVLADFQERLAEEFQNDKTLGECPYGQRPQP